MIDPIYGEFEIPNFLKKFVNVPEFQRLRYLTQMGTSQFIFPSARHSRFEHSLGVSHLCNRFVNHLSKHVKLSEREQKCIQIAGLYHDIGHGPFSHLFDSQLMTSLRPDLKWTHEMGSQVIINHIIDRFDEWNEGDIKLIKSLVSGNPSNNQLEEHGAFLYEIVANSRNGVDVDKFDYIARDSYHIGYPVHNFSWLIPYTLSSENGLSYDISQSFNLSKLFSCRYDLFKSIYTHPGSKAIEYMIIDALKLMDNEFGISSAVESLIYNDNIDDYCSLSESIITDALRSKSPVKKLFFILVSAFCKVYLEKDTELPILYICS